MKKVVIIGCGFGGLSAAIKLSAKADLEVMVVDQRKNFTFLPLLPDIIGREFSPENLIYPIEKLSQKYKFKFVNNKVMKVELETNKIVTGKEELNYDYLIIAAGSETNFYGNTQIMENAFKVDDQEDAKKIHDSVLSGKYDTFFISGGGYTGVEVATNLKKLLNKHNSSQKVIILEVGPSLLGPLPDWMKEYVKKGLARMGIEYRVKTSVQKIENGTITLSDGQQLSKAMLIWSAGVKTPQFVSSLSIEKTKQGRLKVNEYLQIENNCYVVGDCAAFSTLRMSARFAIQEGRVAAENIVRQVARQEQKKYQAFDWGYFIPMANNWSCGIALGNKLKGFIGILGHYFLCLWLSYGFKNRLGILKKLLFKLS